MWVMHKMCNFKTLWQSNGILQNFEPYYIREKLRGHHQSFLHHKTSEHSSMLGKYYPVSSSINIPLQLKGSFKLLHSFKLLLFVIVIQRIFHQQKPWKHFIDRLPTDCLKCMKLKVKLHPEDLNDETTNVSPSMRHFSLLWIVILRMGSWVFSWNTIGVFGQKIKWLPYILRATCWLWAWCL